MVTRTKNGDRRQLILEALACELEIHPGVPVTTAALAKAAGISEAALYRHFPSKAKMFEALIEFAEETIFGIAARIQSEEPDAMGRCEKMMQVLLSFSGRNPGITRILLGDALVGEQERLRTRVNQFYERLETQLRQVLREGLVKQELPPDSKIAAVSSLLLAVLCGRMAAYARSGFTQRPLEHWDEQWRLMSGSVFTQRQRQFEEETVGA